VKSISHVHTGVLSLSRFRFAAIAGFACFALSACSPGADYPTIFPAIHDMPPPRVEAPLDANQVQQATEDLIAERNRLNGGPAKPAGSTAGSSTANSPPPRKQPPAQPAVQTTANSTAGSTPAGGSESK
jgi:hypothetical protein